MVVSSQNWSFASRALMHVGRLASVCPDVNLPIYPVVASNKIIDLLPFICIMAIINFSTVAINAMKSKTTRNHKDESFFF